MEGLWGMEFAEGLLPARARELAGVPDSACIDALDLSPCIQNYYQQISMRFSLHHCMSDNSQILCAQGAGSMYCFSGIAKDVGSTLRYELQN